MADFLAPERFSSSEESSEEEVVDEKHEPQNLIPMSKFDFLCFNWQFWNRGPS